MRERAFSRNFSKWSPFFDSTYEILPCYGIKKVLRLEPVVMQKKRKNLMQKSTKIITDMTFNFSQALPEAKCSVCKKGWETERVLFVFDILKSDTKEKMASCKTICNHCLSNAINREGD